MKDGLSFSCGACTRARTLASKRKRVGPPKTRSRQGLKDVPTGSTWCPQCGAVKLLGEFPRNRHQPNGRGAYCQPCHAVNSRAIHLPRKYNLTPADADRLVAEQGGLCAICREAPAQHVDHDHVTERVRGLLCFTCNGALGQVRDRRDLMARAIAYLDGGPRAVLDAEPFGFARALGPCETTRPADEPAPL